MNRLELLVPPPLVMLIVGILMWVLARIFPTFTLAWLHGTRVSFAVGVLGLAISLAGMVAFRRANTTMDPRHPADTSNLVRSGIYRYSRNPMYLGVLLVLVGWALYLGNVLSMLGLVVFASYLTRFQIIPEERLLTQKFGKAFEEYRSQVRRWL